MMHAMKGHTPRYGRYVFDNAAAQSLSRLSTLEGIWDPETIRRLTELGVAEGANCLEVGAGAGGIARWLSDRVGDAGRVLAIDIDTRFLEALRAANLEVRRLDIASDPLPQAAFDLVHARFVLEHLPDREQALDSLVRALKPGGCLLAEDMDLLSLMPDPAANPAEVLLPSRLAQMQFMQEQGVELRYGRLLAGRLRARGLRNVDSEGRTFMWQGGSTGAALHRANLEQLAGDLIDSGRVTKDQLEQDISRLDDPDYMAPSGIMWAAWGRAA
jgi:SAM-dependent methyltransferase